MANLIQIKRSLNTATPGSLANGEMAFTANGDALFIGSNGAVVAIGGKRTPGTLTANQALVANATGYLDSIKVANAVLTQIHANGSHGSAGQVLVSDGANVYWGTGTSGTNTQIQFNDSGVANGSAGFTFNKAANALFVGNTVTVGANVVLSVSSLTIGNSSVNAVTNSSTLTVTNVSVTNATITKIYANGAHGTENQVLTSNSTGGLFFAAPSATNLDGLTDVEVTSASVGQILIAQANGVFLNKSISGDITISNTGVVAIAADSVALGTDTTGNYVATITAGSGISGSSSSEGGAATIAVVANNGIVANSSGVFAKAANGVSVDSSGINVVAGGGIVSNTSGVFANTDNSTLEISGGAIQVKNDGIALGTKTTGNYVATITAGNGLSGNATTEGSAPTIAVVAGSGIASNSTGVFVVAGDGITSNSTGVFVTDGSGLSVNSTGVHVGAGDGISTNATSVSVVANSGLASNSSGVHVVANNGITSNSTGVFVRPGTDGGLSTNSTGVWVVAGDGLSTNATGLHIGAGAGISVDASNVAVVANSGIVANATGVFAKAANGISVDGSGINVTAGTGVTVNTSGVHIGQAVGTTSNVTFNDLTVNGNTVIGSNFSDVVTINAGVNSNILPIANVTHSLGNNTLRFNEIYAANTRTVNLAVDQNVEISGNLTVSGSLVTINVSTLAVTDSLIQLASNNTTTDTLDIGFFGNYNIGGGASEFAGLFRDATSDSFKLFKGLQDAPTTVVDTSGTGYTIASLEAYLSSGGLVSNSTAVTLTANGTVAVNMTANSLSLSTALPGSSGGTGLSSYTAEQILVANSSNGFRKLGVGSEGYVLQVVSGAVAYGTLDGGSF